MKNALCLVISIVGRLVVHKIVFFFHLLLKHFLLLQIQKNAILCFCLYLLKVV